MVIKVTIIINVLSSLEITYEKDTHFFYVNVQIIKQNYELQTPAISISRTNIKLLNFFLLSKWVEFHDIMNNFFRKELLH